MSACILYNHECKYVMFSIVHVNLIFELEFNTNVLRLYLLSCYSDLTFEIIIII